MAIFSPDSFIRRSSWIVTRFFGPLWVDMLETFGVGPAHGVLPFGESETLIRSRAEWQVVLRTLAMLPDDGEERLDVLRAALEIHVADVHDEEGGLVVVEEEVVVRLSERLEPRAVDRALVVPAAMSHASEQHVRARLQEH